MSQLAEMVPDPGCAALAMDTRLFGLGRVSRDAEELLESGIDALCHLGELVETDGRITAVK